MNVETLLNSLAAAPKQWRCTANFSDGKVITLDQPTQAMAEAHANSKRRFLGKVFATKDGAAITLDSVTVTRI